MKEPPIVPVIMRRFRGELLAVFPTIPGTNAWDMTCYSVVGQHGTMSMEAYRQSVAAPFNGAHADLWREIVQIYEQSEDPVRLVQRLRITPDMNRMRATAANRD